MFTHISGRRKRVRLEIRMLTLAIRIKVKIGTKKQVANINNPNTIQKQLKPSSFYG